MKFVSSGLMLLDVDKLTSDTIALAHNGKQNGNVMADPDMVVRIYLKVNPRFYRSHSLYKYTSEKSKRDELWDKFGIKAIETEAFSTADSTWNHEVGYLVARGICDFCDSQK